ncbi:MAG TPA: CBS domain-containing protein, partial [Gemmatimonadaceae bacterium]|nr:CBS domain-containing protein [Gemmatimonadaceae bacterium]
MVTDDGRTTASPELLYLLHGDPSELAEALAGMRAADVADALRDLGPEPGAKVMAALPFDLAVQVFDEPELDRHRAGIIQRMPPESAAALAEAMSADQRADLVRELKETDRVKLLKLLDAPTRRSLEMLLDYPPESAGGIMTTEFVAIPETWRVEQALRHIGEVGRAKETVYAVYVLDPDQRLVHVVSLRELMTAERGAVVTDVGDHRRPLTVRPLTDREEVARTISKYNLLAVPVVDDGGHVLGIVTVDDVIDAIVREQTEDVQKFGGMEALDAPYMEIGLGRMIRKRAGWLCALFLSEMLTATAMQH